MERGKGRGRKCGRWKKWRKERWKEDIRKVKGGEVEGGKGRGRRGGRWKEEGGKSGRRKRQMEGENVRKGGI